MSKIITFSRHFPFYHYKKWKPTYFVEQILQQQKINYTCDNYLYMLVDLNKISKLSFEDIESFFISLQKKEDEKSHTIRSGNRFKRGEMFSPRCWFGKPYNSPQIIFLPDIKIEKIWRFEVTKTGYIISNIRKRVKELVLKPSYLLLDELTKIAYNDGLNRDDFELWFPKPFKGQIICWNEEIDY